MRARSPAQQFRVAVRASDGQEWSTAWDDDEVAARRLRDEYARKGEDLYVGPLEGSPRQGRVFVVQARTVTYGEPRDVGAVKHAPQMTRWERRQIDAMEADAAQRRATEIPCPGGRRDRGPATY